MRFLEFGVASLAEGSGKALLLETRVNVLMEGAVGCVASRAVLGLAVRGIVAREVKIPTSPKGNYFPHLAAASCSCRAM